MTHSGMSAHIFRRGGNMAGLCDKKDCWNYGGDFDVAVIRGNVQITPDQYLTGLCVKLTICITCEHSNFVDFYEKGEI